MKIHLPVLVNVADYHDFDAIQSMLRLVSSDIVVEEIEGEPLYLGLIYEKGNVPSSKQISTMVVKKLRW